MDNKRQCSTCDYSVSTLVIDPVLASIPNTHGLAAERISTKCHIQGPPKEVNADKDWCYQWRPRDRTGKGQTLPEKSQAILPA